MGNLLTTEQAILRLERLGMTQLIYDCYYEYDVLAACERFAASEEWHAVLDLLAPFAPSGGRILDLGAGNGISSYAFARQGFEVVAVEPDPSSLVGNGAIHRMIASTALPISCDEALGEKLPYADGSFDVVYMRQVMHHAHDITQMTREIYRVLKPSGVVLACREHIADDGKSLQSFLDNHPLHKYTGTENAYSLEIYKQALSDAGLSSVKILGPHESVINYYPTTVSEATAQIREMSIRKFKGAGKLLVLLPVYRQLVAQYLSAHDHTPGRMYTFLFQKRPK